MSNDVDISVAFGWYKGVKFANIHEFFFLKQLENENVDMREDVSQQPIVIDGTDGFSVKPAFYLQKRTAAYDIIDCEMMTHEQVLLRDSVTQMLAATGISYKVIDTSSIPLPNNPLKALNNPCVQLDNALTDRLNTMFEQQEVFMKLLQCYRSFPKFPVDLLKKDSQRFIKEVSYDCMHELFEAIHLLKNSKSHRKTNVAEFDREGFLEELTDVMHYFIEICIVSGISPNELFSAYLKKGTVNSARILANY